MLCLARMCVCRASQGHRHDQNEDLKRAFVMADCSGTLLAAWEDAGKQTMCKNAQRAYKLHVEAAQQQPVRARAQGEARGSSRGRWAARRSSLGPR